MENKYGKSDAERLLLEVHDWIKTCDNKASILLAFVAIIIGLTTDIFKVFSVIYVGMNGSVGNIVLSILLIILICAYFLFLVLSVYSLTIVLFARTRKLKKITEEKSPNTELALFFGSIAKISEEEFSIQVKSLSEEELVNKLNEQIVINSKIADIKFKAFNKALIYSLILCAVVIITLAIIS